MAVPVLSVRRSDQARKPSVMFNPDDRTVVRHTKAGVWDIYNDISGFTRRKLFRLPFLSKVKAIKEAYQGRAHVLRMVHDITTLENCALYFVAWTVLKFVSAFMPAVALWYTGQLLRLVEVAVETRTVDRDALFKAAALRIVVPVVRHALRDGVELLAWIMLKRIDHYYTFRAFRSASNLDVPTAEDESIRHAFSGLASRSGYTAMTWYMFTCVMDVFSGVIQVASQVMVVIGIFHGNPEAMFLVAISLAHIAVDQISSHARMFHRSERGIFAFKTANDDYMLSRGLRNMVGQKTYRKDIVAGGLGDILYTEFKRTILSLGDDDVDPHAAIMQRRSWTRKIGDYLRDPVQALGQVYTCLKVVNSPSAAPLSLATLQLVNSAMASLTQTAYVLGNNIDHISEQVERIRVFYATLDLQNKIPDGSEPFPENQQDIAMGISVEFRNVSFRYSEKDDLVLKNVSFKIEQGHLCVIVGENGTGKSTILNLITRLYDVVEGEVLINGRDIRTLKLADVRTAIAVLFQEYSIFPMNLARNIGYGDPDRHDHLESIKHAAKLGGAEEFIESLPYKYATYVERPVSDCSGGEPNEDSIFAGKTVDFSKLNLNADQKGLSGGQKQRIALSRTFMKSLVSTESKVGMLLFDEPSASLDPKAEHELFTRLRQLRGSKTMIFSSHRFGKLTRHADLILYIHQGEVLEAGSHSELMKKPDGEYAKLWNMQAQDFL